MKNNNSYVNFWQAYGRILYNWGILYTDLLVIFKLGSDDMTPYEIFIDYLYTDKV